MCEDRFKEIDDLMGNCLEAYISGGKENFINQIIEQEKKIIANAVRDYAKKLWFWEKVFITIERTNLFRAINTLLTNMEYEVIKE
jgi:hypothetical protein